MPNDPAVDRVLKAASDVLRRAGKSASIDGYKEKSRTRVWELASAFWSAVAGLQLSYALPPAGFEKHGQKIRTPGAILESRIGTCLDTALLFAAVLEQASLNPLLVLTKGHAFVGVWLQPQEFSQLINEEAAAVRKRIELQELLVFETTLITNSPPPNFRQAVEHARRQLGDETFDMVIDIRRARMQRIRPLALPTAGIPVQPDVPGAVVSESLEEAPVLPGFDVEADAEVSTPADRVAMWQRKLLDLTTRNRLLHLPEGGKYVPLLCPEPALLEDRLAEGKRIKIVPIPELEAGGRDAALYVQQHHEELHERYAREALQRGEVLSSLAKGKLETELVDLYRKARSDLDEGGANTLFLAVGFLKWKKSADDPKQYRAPLILLPIKLERKSALSGVTMVLHEDEPRFNLTLLELLRQDFELNIAGLDGPLPVDENGIDVARIWNAVRQAVRDVPGFEVNEEVVIGTFSFAKYLMWKDLADRKDQLAKSPVVRHLIERAAETFGSEGDFPMERDLDKRVNPSQLFTPLPADSSQLAAVVASANGCNFVLVGPPGTGKSQTIANMIAHNLALGRRVLFVAEKMAALEVVFRRLEEKGLGEFCLQIHSNKTSKVDVLKQLERAWEARDSLSQDEWQREAREVQRLRDRLNEVVALLHERRSNGLTLHGAIGRVVRFASSSTPRLSWPPDTNHRDADLISLRDVARRLDLNWKSAAEAPAGFKIIAHRDWSNGWQEAVSAACEKLPLQIDELVAARDKLLQTCRLPVMAGDLVQMERLAGLVEAIIATHERDLGFAFAGSIKEVTEALRSACELVEEYQEMETNLSTGYKPEAASSINLTQLDADWAAAAKKFWFLSGMAKKKVCAALAHQGGANSLPDFERDMPALHAMRRIISKVRALEPILMNFPGWAGLTTDTAKVLATLELAERLRQSISVMAESPEMLIEMRTAVRKVVVEANDLLSPDGAIASAASVLQAQINSFKQGYGRFQELCNVPKEADLELAALRDAALSIQERKARLKAWCDWRRVRAEAVDLGLLPLIEALEGGAIPAGEVPEVFETAYARWFAAGVIDAEPQLRGFVAAEHMSDIEAYRRLDDNLAKLSVRYIRAQLCEKIPSKNDSSRKDGFGVLKAELQKQRRHKPLRQLAAEMGEAMTRLAPCMLMSPLSIAQYLPVEQQLFDLVIFDEASQIAPWDAIGSIARGKQVVIAGDPRQMPPTSFFNRSANSVDEDVEEDMESILDECLAAGIPRHCLTWHYRSRHESLIAFSNHRYYDSNLITFPAAVTRESAVSWRRVNGVYAKGKGRTNQTEAEAMVAEVVNRLTDAEFVRSNKTLAIVTLNAEQQKLVEDLLDRSRRQHPQIERFFGDEMTEPVVVKNLETVQGDERDLILLGIGYGPTEPGSNVMSMSFGPLNREGGWRRLNVALTRARQEMIVFSSFDSTMIDLNRTGARAVCDLKHFLEFAERGPRALAEAIGGSLGSYDSPFEAGVAERLRDLGWQVVPQIGVSRFRIDLGIVHPDRAGDYLLGVECDGASYHSAATARDRDKVRAAVLSGLGWKLVRVWSTEWWVDQEGALERLHASISAELERTRNVRKEALGVPAAEEEPLPPQAAEHLPLEVRGPVETMADLLIEATQVPASAKAAAYRVADFTPFSAQLDANQFYEGAYDGVLTQLISHVLACEGPIEENLLVQRIARGHGFQKAGRLIRERVLDLVDRHHLLRPDPIGGRFAWLTPELPAQWCEYRPPASIDDARSIEDIAFEELRAAAATIEAEDVALEVARLFGVRRLTSQSRERLEAVLKVNGGGC